MVGGHIFKVPAKQGGDTLVGIDSALFHGVGGKSLGHDIEFTVGTEHAVFLVRIQGNGLVSGQSPDGGGPDDEIGLGKVAERGQLSLVVCHFELDINRGAGVILILDFGFCQSRLILGAPVYRLQSFIDIPLFKHLPEDLHLPCLKRGVHGQIRMVPVADNTQALELTHLNVYIVLGEGLTPGAEFRNRHLFPVQLALLDDGGFNGHSVVVPAGNVGNSVAGHAFILVDEVL